MRALGESKGSVQVISKVLRILEAIQTSPWGLTLKPICDLTGVHKSTAHRFLKQLQREGYLLRTETGAYLIGPKLSQMGTRTNPQATLNAVARPVLSDLWKNTQETVNLAVLDHASVLYIEVIESPHDFRLSSQIGTRRPIYSTALGKALAAFLDEEQLEPLLNSLSFQALTSRPISNLLQLRQELATVKQQSYAVDDACPPASSRIRFGGLACAMYIFWGSLKRTLPSPVSPYPLCSHGRAAAPLDMLGRLECLLGGREWRGDPRL